MKKQQDWEKFIEEIMQDGYDVAMFGDPFMDNIKEKQEKEYNRVVKKHSKFIQKQITKAREEGVREGVEEVIKLPVNYVDKYQLGSGFEGVEQLIPRKFIEEYLKSLKDKK